jgi:antitoxin HicB
LLTPQEEGGFVVEFPDLGGFTQGEDEEEALLNAVDLLETLIAFKIKDNEDIPQPSEIASYPLVAVPPVAAAKLLIYWEMKRQKIRKSTLAKRLNWHGPQMDRLLDIRHESKFSQIQTVLAALGKSMVVDLEDRGIA